MAEMKQTFQGMQKLQAGLVQDLQEPNTNVKITNSSLIVTFVNSHLASQPEEQRARTARHVAEFVRDHYVGYSTLSRVSVGFQSRASVGVASASKTEVPYSFTTAELGPAPALPQPASPDSSAHPAS
jgi:hypothetical protein